MADSGFGELSAADVAAPADAVAGRGHWIRRESRMLALATSTQQNRE